MPVSKQEEWDKIVAINDDPFSKCVVDIAREVMRILDEEIAFEAEELINRADDNIKAGGITGFMAGAAAQIVSRVHSRGEEFRLSWNGRYNVQSDEGVVNPAIITIEKKEN